MRLKGLKGGGPWERVEQGTSTITSAKACCSLGTCRCSGRVRGNARARLFADPRVTAIASWRQPGLAQIAEQALGQVLPLLLGGLLELMYGIGDQGDGMSETEPITVQANLLGGLQHEGAHRIVAQEHAIEFLLDALGGLRTQRVVTEALVRIDVVDGGLDFPALVRAQDQLPGAHRAGVEQGGDQPMQFAMARSLRILNAVVEDARQQWPTQLFAGVIFGREV